VLTLERERARDAAAFEKHWQSIMPKMYARLQKWSDAVVLLRFIDAALEQYKTCEQDPEIENILDFAHTEAESQLRVSLDLGALKFVGPTATG
jgi:hypothetical protein